MSVARTLSSRPPPTTNPPSSPLPPLPTPITPAEAVPTRKLGRFFSAKASRSSAAVTSPTILQPPRTERVDSLSNIASTSANTTTTSASTNSSSKPPRKSLPLVRKIHRSTSYGDFPSPSISSGVEAVRKTPVQRTVSLESAVHGLPFSRTSPPTPTTPLVPGGDYGGYFPFASSDIIEEALDEETWSNSQHEYPSDIPSTSRSSSSLSQSGVVVSVRVRPDLEDNNGTRDWAVDGAAATISYLGREGGDYIYDNVFTNHDTNDHVYTSAAKQLVRRVMEGYRGTVFAYGMTGSGKTYSMQGTNSEPGVIPNAVADIFTFIRETPNREFLLRVSYLEIFNERIYDLLAQDAAPEAIKLREDSRRGVYASPLREEIVQTPSQLLRIIGRGHQVRRTSSTQFNARSSRSHAVIQIVIESRERASPGSRTTNNRLGLVTSTGFRVSTLNLIDLAGSERASDSRERRTEGGHINKSLLVLGTIVSRLSANKGKDVEKHLPYRDSKLTRLLQSALSGNALISILCTIQLGSDLPSGLATNYNQETISTLKFAARARNNIVSHAKRMEEEIVDTRALLAEITELRKLVADRRQSCPVTTAPSQRQSKEDEIAKERELVAEQRHSEQMLEMQIARMALKERIEQLNQVVMTFKTAQVKQSVQRRPRDSTIEACIKSLSSCGTLAIDTESVGSIGSIRSGPLNATSDLGSSLSSSSSSSLAKHEDPRHGLPTAATTTDNDLHLQLASQTRYIASLEQELILAARASAPTAHDLQTSALLREKDSEIRELRERLIDKDRMLAALRGAVARRHDSGTTAAAAQTGSVPAPASKFANTQSSRTPGSTGAKRRVVCRTSGTGLSRTAKSSSLPAAKTTTAKTKTTMTAASTPTAVTIPKATVKPETETGPETEIAATPSPNPSKKITEMTRLLREMASSIAVPEEDDEDEDEQAREAREQAERDSFTPRQLRFTSATTTGNASNAVVIPALGTISPPREARNGDSDDNDCSHVEDENKKSSVLVMKTAHEDETPSVTGLGLDLGLATPPASPI